MKKILDVKKELEKLGHEIILPNYIEEPFAEDRIKKEFGEKEHSK